jgi:hypothetical protein
MLHNISITITVDSLEGDDLRRLRLAIDNFIDCGAQYISVRVRGPVADDNGLARVLGDAQARLVLRHGMVTAQVGR